MTHSVLQRRRACAMADSPTMQDVLQRFYPGYLDSYVPNAQQDKVVRHILNCKTGAYGVNVSRCSSCGHVQFHNNSCRDRSCPMCQALSNELWIDAQNEHVLDTDYYHIVFTCPSELNPLIYCNQKELYSLFFHTVAETVLELSANPAHLGGTPGFISVMHTWSSNLSYHPHIHVLCTGGGLDADRNWHQKREGYFLPGKAIAKVFRGKFLSGLKDLHKDGKLCYAGEAEKYRNHYEYQELINLCFQKNWVTDIRESFAGAESVMHYLGRYTHRIAISNGRILRMDEKSVTFRVKDYRNGGVWKELTLDGVEFVRRFLMHVPPRRFVRIRHYGLLSNQKKRRLIPLCRNLIGCREFLRRFRKDDKVRAIRILYKIDVTKCPKCGDTMCYEPGLRQGYQCNSSA
ncbi:MAG: IS91 family transposase [Lachnospiraceae bacterium]|nr:IS91 family transposase [Lachnospiraceae bacterium]